MIRELPYWVFCSVFCVFAASCATIKTPTRANCSGLVAEAAAAIDAGKKTYVEVGKQTVGETGFFYVIGPKGVIVYHPNTPLTGRDVSDVPQVRAILALDSGVNTDSQGGLVRTVFFRRLASGNMLCFTISDDELDGR